MKNILKYWRPALCLFAIWTLVGLCFSGVELVASATDNRPLSIWTVVTGNLFRAYVWGALSPLVYLFARRHVIDPRRIAWRKVDYNLGFGLFLSAIYPWIIFVIGLVVFPNYPETVRSLKVLFFRQLIYSWYTIISLYLPTFLAIQALLFLRRYREEEAKNAALVAAVSQARLNALKMQLHPHFLFNSLHAISSLILVDPGRANKMVALVGDFLRQTLDHSADQMVTLEEELAFLRCYLEIEETRFEDRLTVDFDIDPEALGVKVPHMILQPIVENAVKHGIAPFAAAGRILISAKLHDRELVLRIHDSGTGSAAEGDPAPTNGVGIANVRSRLEGIYGNAASLRISATPGQGFQVELTLPLVMVAPVGLPDESC